MRSLTHTQWCVAGMNFNGVNSCCSWSTLLFDLFLSQLNLQLLFNLTAALLILKMKTNETDTRFWERPQLFWRQKRTSSVKTIKKCVGMHEHDTKLQCCLCSWWEGQFAWVDRFIRIGQESFIKSFHFFSSWNQHPLQKKKVLLNHLGDFNPRDTRAHVWVTRLY